MTTLAQHLIPAQRSVSPDTAPRAGLCRGCGDTFWNLDRHAQLDDCTPVHNP